MAARVPQAEQGAWGAKPSTKANMLQLNNHKFENENEKLRKLRL